MPGSGVLLELLAVLIYAAVTPVVLVVLSVKQRRSPISLIRSVGPFFREFDARSPPDAPHRCRQPSSSFAFSRSNSSSVSTFCS